MTKENEDIQAVERLGQARDGIVSELCLPVLRHRIIPNFAARSDGETADTLIARLLAEVPSDENLLKRKVS